MASHLGERAPRAQDGDDVSELQAEEQSAALSSTPSQASLTTSIDQPPSAPAAGPSAAPELPAHSNADRAAGRGLQKASDGLSTGAVSQGSSALEAFLEGAADPYARR